MTSITNAVAELERRSCAEVVAEVRARSGSYADADARFATLLAFAALLFLLFSPWRFGAFFVAIDVALVYAIGLYVARSSSAVRRLMTTQRERNAQVRTAAAAAFYERGVANTERESGVLVYLSLFERRIEILADRGVLEAVPSLEWNQLVDAARQERGDPEAMTRVVGSLTPLLACHLPSRDGDRDELSNEPRFLSE